jgi:hypothetical protein
MSFMPGFILMPDDPTSPTSHDKKDGKASWRELDVQRAISAAEKAGLNLYRVELAPDGTISIVVRTES